jgi:hypothetical protein
MASPVWPLLCRLRSWQLKLQLVSYHYRREISSVLVYRDSWRSSLVFNRLWYISDGWNVCVCMSTVKRCLLVKFSHVRVKLWFSFSIHFSRVSVYRLHWTAFSNLIKWMWYTLVSTQLSLQNTCLFQLCVLMKCGVFPPPPVQASEKQHDNTFSVHTPGIEAVEACSECMVQCCSRSEYTK